MAAPRFTDIADLNEFGLPKHGGPGVGPTLRPDLIAERHRHDWDRPASEPLAFAAAPESLTAETGLSAHLLADDLLHRARGRVLGPEGADFREMAAPDNPAGDNEQQGARLVHALAQGSERRGSTEGG